MSESAALEGERLKVRGLLHARGAGMPLDIDATLRRAGDELEVEAVTLADHHQLGMTWNFMGMLRPPSKPHHRGPAGPRRVTARAAASGAETPDLRMTARS